MSSALAIAGVTAVLRDLLNNGLIDHDVPSTLGEVAVRALPPDRLTADTEHSQLNLFLYLVSYNPGWRNIGLPSRASDGSRLSNPPLALDLHYLLMAYGARELHAEILLGWGLQILHETPVLTRAAIARALAPPEPIEGGFGLPIELEALNNSGLAEQVEQVKLTPQPFTGEDMLKIWTSFQTPYRPSAAFQAIVVLIENRQPARAPLPVRTRNLYVMRLPNPVIDRLLSQKAAGQPVLADQPILPGDRLVIRGTGLSGQGAGMATQVLIGGVDVSADVVTLGNLEIVVTIPTAVPAGTQPVQIVQLPLMGTPPVAHPGFSSNQVPLVLRPVVSGIQMVTTSPPQGGAFQVGVVPPVGDRQQVTLLLNRMPPAAPQSYALDRPPLPWTDPPGQSGSISVPFAAVAPGTYLVRLRVDGADSLLAADANGNYTGPTVLV